MTTTRENRPDLWNRRIARDIQRCLIPKHLEELAEVNRKQAEADEHAAGKARAEQELSAILGEAPREGNFYYSRDGVHLRLRVDSADSVTVDRAYLTLAQAKQLAELFKSW